MLLSGNKDLHSTRDRRVSARESIEETRSRHIAARSLWISQKVVDTISAQGHATFIRSNRVKSVIRALLSVGIEDPKRLINTFPALLTYAPERITSIPERLSHLGFPDPVRIIRATPSVVWLSIHTIEQKIDDLRTLGFVDPQSLIHRNPSLIKLSVADNIEPKLEALKAAWIDNPIGLIEKFPAFLSTSSTQLVKKITMLHMCITLCNMTESIENLLRKNPVLMTSKSDKLWILARVLREILPSTSPLTPSNIEYVLREKLEVVVLSVLRYHPKSMTELLAKIRHIKQLGFTDTELRYEISCYKNTELTKRYLRGYPNS